MNSDFNNSCRMCTWYLFHLSPLIFYSWSFHWSLFHKGRWRLTKSSDVHSLLTLFYYKILLFWVICILLGLSNFSSFHVWANGLLSFSIKLYFWSHSFSIILLFNAARTMRLLRCVTPYSTNVPFIVSSLPEVWGRIGE